MKKLMDELMAEEKAEALKQKSSWTKSAALLPLKFGGSLLSKVVLPYLVGSRKRRDLDSSFKKVEKEVINIK